MKLLQRLIPDTEGLLHLDSSTLVKLSTKGSGLAAVPRRGLLLLFVEEAFCYFLLRTFLLS